jgi:hypothetical protein
MPERNAQGKVDGINDVICPVDFDWSDERAIKGSDFQRMFASVSKEVIFNWVSDSCHSGHLIRSLAPGQPKMLSRAMIPPVDISWRLETANQKNITPLTFARSIEKGDNVALISGCKSDQTSADTEFEGRPNGALTYYLLKELKSPLGLKEPLTNVVANVRVALLNAVYAQTPQLEGSPLLSKDSFLSLKKTK